MVDSAQPHSRDQRRLHGFALRETLPTGQPGLPSYAGDSDRNFVQISSGTLSHGPGVDRFENEGSIDGFGVNNQGILKKTDFLLDSRSDDETTDWIRGHDGHAEYGAFHRV